MRLSWKIDYLPFLLEIAKNYYMFFFFSSPIAFLISITSTSMYEKNSKPEVLK